MAEASVNGSNIPRFPSNEEEAQEMLIEAHGRDPEKIRKAAQEAFDSMNALAAKLDERKAQEEGSGAKVTVVQVGEKTTEEKKSEETKEPTKVVLQQHQTEVSEPAKKVQDVAPPTGYMELPEGLYTWSPDIWGGRPLYGVPDRVVEKNDRPTIIVFILVAPAFGRNRRGAIVSLPEGAKVVVHAGVAWGPMIPVAKGPEGRPVIWAAPMTVDNGKLRIANASDKLHSYETADGGREYGLSILYDPDPKDPSKPRLISLETLRGANG